MISCTSNVTLNKTDSICYLHEKMFLTRYESLQKYCSDHFAPHILKLLTSCTIILFVSHKFVCENLDLN